MNQQFKHLPEYKQRESIQSWYEPALNLLNKMLERNKVNLRKRGYNEKNAAITREEFRQELARQGRITLYLAGEIETSLYKAQKIEYIGGYGLWATPAASDSTRGGKITANMTGISLAQQIKTPERWPTPKASDAKRMDCLSERNRKSPCLESTVKMWPTPKASDWNKRGNVSPHPRNGLPGAVMNFPTPTASDANKWSNESLAERKAKGRQIRLNTAVSPEGGNGGRLNPNWVEWLMGWPIGWTDLKPLEMDKFQSWRKAHLNF